MNTGVAWRDIKTQDGIERHEVLKIIMKVAQRKLAEQKQNGVKFKYVADTIGVPKTKISDAYHGRYISKKTLKLLIGYNFVKLDDILPEISKDQIKIIRHIVPEWA